MDRICRVGIVVVVIILTIMAITMVNQNCIIMAGEMGW